MKKKKTAIDFFAIETFRFAWLFIRINVSSLFSLQVFSFLNNYIRMTWAVLHFSSVIALMTAENAFVLSARGLCRQSPNQWRWAAELLLSPPGTFWLQHKAGRMIRASIWRKPESQIACGANRAHDNIYTTLQIHTRTHACRQPKYDRGMTTTDSMETSPTPIQWWRKRFLDTTFVIYCTEKHSHVSQSPTTHGDPALFPPPRAGLGVSAREHIQLKDKKSKQLYFNFNFSWQHENHKNVLAEYKNLVLRFFSFLSTNK